MADSSDAISYTENRNLPNHKEENPNPLIPLSLLEDSVSGSSDTIAHLIDRWRKSKALKQHSLTGSDDSDKGLRNVDGVMKIEDEYCCAW
ncbi:hypothetical protein LWI28_014002 [Acer negundo]|uniref:Uncharacterized protein n=1 Tax=Acer negundo TaxID=4023 RepID=A0AAD5NHT5_ACENE|nr:hypothetical protein LWI28_014002 [Acer negundo]KAK4842931.1 hypothetical protein QYF36_001741 [Acer negundo]